MTKRTPFVCNSCVVRRVTERAHSPPLSRAYLSILRSCELARPLQYIICMHIIYFLYISKKHTRDTVRINNASSKNKNRTQYP